jgi:hypothetical protein
MHSSSQGAFDIDWCIARLTFPVAAAAEGNPTTADLVDFRSTKTLSLWQWVPNCSHQRSEPARQWRCVTLRFFVLVDDRTSCCCSSRSRKTFALDLHKLVESLSRTTAVRQRERHLLVRCTSSLPSLVRRPRNRRQPALVPNGAATHFSTVPVEEALLNGSDISN